MNNLQNIIIKLKATLTPNTKGRVLDKQVATALNIKPTTLASLKRRDNAPYKAILTYCHDNRIDVRKLLFDDAEPIVSYPHTAEDGKVRVRYFRTLDGYADYLNDKPVS